MRSDLIANDDPVKAERARRLLRNAAKAVDEFEDAIRELVSMRAWAVLGYQGLADMWEAENGFRCPDHAKVVAVEAMAAEGMNTRFGTHIARLGPNGHTTTEVAVASGLRVKPVDGGKSTGSGAVSSVLRQLKHGVPPEHVTLNDNHRWQNKRIEKYGRSRPQPRRRGKTPDELVTEGMNLPRRDADAIAEIARKADVPKSEIYRQAVAEYLARHGVSTHFGAAENGANPEPRGTR